MGVRAAATGRLILEGVKLPAGALLGDGGRELMAECVQLGRLGWCALAVGTGQAVLDYVIPYVNERKAFGEPISNRQAVAFTVANIAIELDGMRLATYRAASRVDQGAVRPRGRARPAAVLGARDGDRLRRRAAARRPRLHQGAPGRALVPRPARRRRDGRGAGRCDQPRDPQEVRVPRQPGPPGRDRGLPPELAQVRPRRAQLPQGARHARRGDRRHERGRRAQRRRRRRRRRQSNGVQGKAATATATAATWPGCSA